MIKRWLYKLTANRPCKLISRNHVPYLERYFVATFWGLKIYLHRFVSGDGDLEVHDHPWWAVAICLAGGYEEDVVTKLDPNFGWFYRSRRIRVGSINLIPPHKFHRITSTRRDTWTLFICGRAVKGWGFLRRSYAAKFGGPNGAVVYHNPYELTGDKPWWLDVPPGRLAGREPFIG